MAQSPDYAGLKQALAEFIDAACLIDDPLLTLAYGTDASFYRLIPKLVVLVANEDEVRRLVRLAKQYHTPLTFRAAGTSLSGQAISDSVLVVLKGNAWLDYEIADEGKTIRLQPGIIGAQANKYLAPLQRKIGPDPASIATCKIGGIAANNASGMCCGVAQNSYQTLKSMRVILADGTLLDSRDPADRQAFAISHAYLLNELKCLADGVKAKPQLAARIRNKYRIKNTTGYSLNALIDFTDPVDILLHLMIGSEGTLGFISEITYQTVPDYADKASALVFFENVATACKAVAKLKTVPVDAVEIMDRAALASVESKPGMPASLSTLPDQAAALLIETRGESRQQLNLNIDLIEQTLAGSETLGEVRFTSVPTEYDQLWRIRKGMFPSVGAVRAAGTAVVIEDIAFPLPALAAGTVELQQLFAKYGYSNAIIFGHALEGNLHFVITPDFGDQQELSRYRKFMDELCHMVVEKYDGSLKAEHSTGRNIAPYVELEWGSEAYELMARIKRLFDPNGLFNPGVILNPDQQVHVKHLKPMAAVDPLVDRCIECGFCEPICPSRNLTLTPRQRIVALRERSRLQQAGDWRGVKALSRQLDYALLETCAGDGLCANRCPVGIDTGQMVRSLREREQGATARRLAGWLEKRISGVTSVTRGTLKLAHVSSRLIGEVPLEKLSSALHRVSGQRIPKWHRWMPRGGHGLNGYQGRPFESEKRCVYFSACVSRSMGTASCDEESRDLIEVIHSLLHKAGYQVVVPRQSNSHCCGLPFKSKGLAESAFSAAEKLEQVLWQASEQGRLPVLCDTSPCTARMREQFQKPLQVFEPVGFIRRFLLPQLERVDQVESIALHISCSARKMGLEKDFLSVAQACANEVVLAEEEGCCGFAGDKGFSLPQLNASALTRLREQLPPGCKQGYSNSRTCEIGLSLHSGIPFRSLAYLVDHCYAASDSDQS
ncbi:MAG: FAD-binding and (Fe-S)-binding domain-containing protein [Candidatus Thiodiazotropha sp.]